MAKTRIFGVAYYYYDVCNKKRIRGVRNDYVKILAKDAATAIGLVRLSVDKFCDKDCDEDGQQNIFTKTGFDPIEVKLEAETD